MRHYLSASLLSFVFVLVVSCVQGLAQCNETPEGYQSLTSRIVTSWPLKLPATTFRLLELRVILPTPVPEGTRFLAVWQGEPGSQPLYFNESDVVHTAIARQDIRWQIKSATGIKPVYQCLTILLDTAHVKLYTGVPVVVELRAAADSAEEAASLTWQWNNSIAHRYQYTRSEHHIVHVDNPVRPILHNGSFLKKEWDHKLIRATLGKDLGDVQGRKMIRQATKDILHEIHDGLSYFCSQFRCDAVVLKTKKSVAALQRAGLQIRQIKKDSDPDTCTVIFTSRSGLECNMKIVYGDPDGWPVIRFLIKSLQSDAKEPVWLEYAPGSYGGPSQSFYFASTYFSMQDADGVSSITFPETAVSR